MQQWLGSDSSTFCIPIEEVSEQVKSDVDLSQDSHIVLALFCFQQIIRIFFQQPEIPAI